MKILILIHSLRRGGAERVVLELALGLEKKGHLVEIVTWLDVDDYLEPEYKRVKKTHLIPKNKYRWIRSIPSSSKLLIQKINNFQPDLIQGHTPSISLLAAWTNSKVPYMHIFHGYGEITKKSSIKNMIVKYVYRFAFKKLNAHIATVSKSMISYASKFLSKPENEFFYLPNGVDLIKFNYVQNLFNNLNEPVITMIGTLCHNKGQFRGINAFNVLLKSFPKAILNIVGDGQDMNILKKHVTDLNLEGSIIFMGLKSNIAEIIAKSDLLWQLSESEALPMTVLESMAIGRPVIGYYVRGVMDVVVHNETGLLTEFGNIAEVASLSKNVLLNKQLYNNFSTSARLQLEKNYSYNGMIDEYENFAIKILN